MLRSFFFQLGICALVSLSVTATYAQECKSTVRTEASVRENTNSEVPGKEITLDFDHFETGPVPNDFLPVLSGQEKAADWEIRPEPTARSSPNILALISTKEGNLQFPRLLYNKFTAKNVEIGVYFKAVSGKIDQAAEILARYQDEKHFYVVRASTFENKVQLDKVIDDIRQPIKSASASVTSGKWHEMQLRVHDSDFQVCFDGTPLFEAKDDTYQHAGKVGLATKSDGVTVFDDLRIIGDKEE